MFKFIGEYLIKGLLIGLGFVVIQTIFYELYSKPRLDDFSQELKDGFESMIDRLYQPGYLKFWEDIETEQPEALLSYNLERVKILDEHVQITGKISNYAPVVWDLLIIEVEAFDSSGKIFAECNQSIKELGPSETETLVFFCNYTDRVVKPDLTEMSFRVIKKYVGNKITPPKHQQN